MNRISSTTSNVTKGLADFALGRPKIMVVEAREKDLKSMPLGRERALAYQQKRNHSFWPFPFPHFTEPALPTAMDIEIDGTLLPPKS